MSAQQRHPQVRWVIYQALPQGGYFVLCEACKTQGTVAQGEQVHDFAAHHREHRSAVPTHYGAGDMVALATKALRIESCTPCEKRRQQMNQAIPRFWRR